MEEEVKRKVEAYGKLLVGISRLIEFARGKDDFQLHLERQADGSLFNFYEAMHDGSYRLQNLEVNFVGLEMSLYVPIYPHTYKAPYLCAEIENRDEIEDFEVINEDGLVNVEQLQIIKNSQVGRAL